MKEALVKNYSKESVTLYTAPQCHLCDEAKALINRIMNRQAFELRCVNIRDDINLMHKYGQTIPVLKRADGSLLYWPFDHAALTGFLM